MKRQNLLLAAILFAAVSAFGATDYGLTVGGVDVTSDNCSNITGDNIKQYKTDVEYYIKYDPSTKTLTIKNIKIKRTGSYNRAILNNDVDGLKIVFIGDNDLDTEDSSPVRLNNNTTITSLDGGKTGIYGDSEDAITIGEGKTLIIDNAHLAIKAYNSNAIIGDTGDETVIIKGGSYVSAITTSSSSSDAAVKDLASLKVIDSYLSLDKSTNGANFGKNILDFSYEGENMGIANGAYSTVNKGFTVEPGLYADFIVFITKYALYNDSRYFDTKFGPYLSSLIQTNQKYILFLPNGLYPENVDQWKSIDVSNKSLSTLKGIEYLTLLETLNCSGNKLASVDLSKNTLLQKLYLNSNSISSLNLSKNTAITDLNVSNNLLSSITLPQSATLKTLYLNNNSLSTVDLTKNSGLTELNISYNKFTSLDVTKNTALTTLNANSNALTSIDLSKCTKLTNLYVNENKLTALNVNSNTLLKEVQCNVNKLSTLIFSKNTALRKISCHTNLIYDNSTNGILFGETFVSNLPNIKPYSGEIIFNYFTSDQNVLTEEQVATANAKNWTIKYSNGTLYPGEKTTGIESIETDASNGNAPRYNLMGQPVDKTYRGVVIQNGKKTLIK